MLRRAQIGHLARESVAGFSRRKLTTGVTVLIMGSALLVLALFVLVALNLGIVLERAQASVDLRVFLVDGLDDQRVAALQPPFLALPGVREARFISKDQALAELRRDLGDDGDILGVLDDNPLPASYHLELAPAYRSTASVEAIATDLRRWPEVADVVYSQAWVGALETWTRLFRWGSLVICVIVLVAAVFVISNTVRLTMAGSRRIIEIQILVGATDGFIRLPFVIEGVLHGLLAGILAMGALAIGFRLLSLRLEGIEFYSAAQIAGFVLFCAVLGLLGSLAAIGQYLRVRRVG
ncbi:MAG TPA: permease-like cell division protein FtsX [Candidatus Krumholzibacteria bacterium]|nr:permease-like cell division protein FtsX [Candidatus Krumholzibacteria bacterium]HPD72323.1 permease-like cell division protein FtsX [Candidatus Krumholzibacteria bacterium]HRY40745.1 permease-like cell division protein FtsX [Candidatus Krumholzibacteria bacterium]